MTTLALITLIAFLLSLGLTPTVRRAALRIGLSDKPDGQRKLHGEATAVGGGVAVLLGFFGAIFVLMTYPNVWGSELAESPRFLIGLMVSSAVLCGVGLVDDRISLRGRQKLLGQAIAASILILSGLMIERVALLGYQLELGVFAFPFTLLWLLGAINALNLIDGVDGLATSVGLILSLGLAGMCFFSEHYSDGVLALMIAGSLAGFLYHNLPPARIFLGDAGSMLIGLVLGALAIRSSLKGPATIALAAPTAIMAVPMFDVAMAIVRRKLTGRSLYAPDRGHIHHRIQAQGYSTVKVLLVFGLLCGVTSLGALVSVYQHNEYLALGSILAVLGTLVVTRVFGHSEFLLLIRKVKRFLSSLVAIHRPSEPPRAEQSLQLQGTREWELLWRMLTDFAERHDLGDVQLTLHISQIQEDFHAHWERRGRPDPDELWKCEIPLRVRSHPVGKVVLSGVCPDTSVCAWMEELIAGLRPFELELVELLQESFPEAFVEQPLPAYLKPVQPLANAS
jgi:UDP-GlcNAc:undecaprenyl-phosphate/decaprenyl-phosphate GlcNAc-1-phosphate transferase